MSVTSYDAKDCTVMVNNKTITGLGEDMVTGEKDEAFFEESVGAQGDVIANIVNNPIGTITLTIQPTSPSKKDLLALAGKKEPFPIQIVNKALKEEFGGSKALLRNYPEMSRGSEAENMEFEFAVFDYSVKAN